MAGCKTDFLCTLLPECQKPVFLMFRKFRFSLGTMPPAPYFIVHQKAILPHQNAKFVCHHINKPIKNNMAILTRYTIQCSKYFVCLLLFEAPKVSLPSHLLVFLFLQRQLIPENVCSLLMATQKV